MHVMHLLLRRERPVSRSHGLMDGLPQEVMPEIVEVEASRPAFTMLWLRVSHQRCHLRADDSTSKPSPLSATRFNRTRWAVCSLRLRTTLVPGGGLLKLVRVRKTACIGWSTYSKEGLSAKRNGSLMDGRLYSTALQMYYHQENVQWNSA